MQLNEERIIKEICVEQVCQECEEPAKWKHTFLLYNARRNTASSAYGRDDCSWCSDEHKFSCDAHREKVEKDKPYGMDWCATFSRKKHEHMFLYWKTISDSSKIK